MFTLCWTEAASATYQSWRTRALESLQSRAKRGKAKSAKVEGLFKQIVKTVELLQANPRHPGLRTHEYRSIPNPFDDTKKVFEAYVQNNTPGAYRVFWCYGPGPKELTILAITAHP